MINTETKALPDLRFPEFNDQWDSSAMGKIYPQIRNGFVGTATPFYCDQGVQYVQGRNIKAGKIQQNGFVSITEAFHQKCSKSQLRTDDILMVQSGHVGECAVVTKDFDDANCHALLVLTPKEKTADSRFYVSYYYSPFGRRRIHIIKTGNTVAHILSSDLKKVSVPKPTLPEQRKIADFLTAVDGRIGQLIQKKALLVDYKKGVMQQLFTQATRFKDDHGNDFPDWEEKKLGELGNTYSGLSGKSGKDFGSGKPYVTYSQIFDQTKIDFTKCKHVQIAPKEKQNRVEQGDILFTTSSETRLEVGYTSVVMSDPGEVYLNSFCFGFRLDKQSVLLTAFARYLFHTSGIRKVIGVLGQGSTRYNLSKKYLMNVVLPLPAPEEQTKIADFLSAIDRKIESVATQITDTQTFKRGLLQQMFV